MMDVKSIRRLITNEFTTLGALCPQLSEAIDQTPKHVPCPVHGGKDGFRLWLNTKHELRGICNTCHDDSSLDIFGLIMWSHQCTFPTAVERVHNYLSGSAHRRYHHTRPNPIRDTANFKNQHRIISAWNSARSISGHGPVKQYLVNRGINLGEHPDSIRSSEMTYWENHKGVFQIVGKFPVMLAQVVDIHGNLTTLHRTYITNNGDKAPVTSPKKLMPPVKPGDFLGCAVRLGEPGKSLYVCEGIETGLAIFEDRNQPVWCALTAGNLERVHLPAQIENLHICADKDRSGRGEEAAHKLAKRLQSNASIKILVPPGRIPNGSQSLDWLDVLTAEKGTGS